MKKLHLLIGFIYTKIIIGIIFLINLLQIFKEEFNFPPKNTVVIWSLWILIFSIITIINIFALVKCFFKNDLETIKKYAYRIKLFLIPYWIINFIVSGAYWGILIGASHGFGMFLIPVPFISAITIFMVTSIYSILCLLLCWKNQQIKNSEFLIYLFSQFCFILDIIGIIILRNKEKNIR